MPTPNSSIKVSHEEDTTIIKLTGALDHHLANNLIGIVPKVKPPLTLDIEETPYITADGLKALFEFHQTHNTIPILIGVKRNNYNLMKLTGLARYFIIDETAIADSDRF